MASVALQTRGGVNRQLSVKQIMKRLEDGIKGTHLNFDLHERSMAGFGPIRAEVYFDLEGNAWVTRLFWEDGDMVSFPNVRMGEVAETLHNHRATLPKPAVDPDYAYVQGALGCADCRFCNRDQLNQGPCCTLPRLNRVNSLNQCLDREGPVPLDWQCEECGGDIRKTGWEHVLLVDRDTVVCPGCAEAIRRRAA